MEARAQTYSKFQQLRNTVWHVEGNGGIAG
jgi:hypothetical protein